MLHVKIPGFHQVKLLVFRLDRASSSVKITMMQCVLFS
ncbi:hypothetical protein FHS96_000941 [Sphingomonas zeicaulis]